MYERRLQMMFYFLSTSDCPLRSKDLASLIGVSDRTIKKDITSFRSYCENNGAKLMSKKGKGYWLEIEHEKDYQELLGQLTIRYNRMNYMLEESSNRVQELIRILICRSDYIRISELGEMLYLSESALRSGMRKAREILLSFQLKLISKPAYGLLIEGSEFAKRLCMVELLEIHLPQAYHTFPATQYMSLMTLEDAVASQVRLVFLKILRDSNVRIVDAYINRITKYLILSINRNQQDNEVQFMESDLKELENFEEYKVAKQIIDKEVEFGMHMTTYEVMGLTLLLLVWADLSEYDDLALRYPNEIIQCSEMVSAAAVAVCDIWNVDLKQFDNYEKVTASALMPLLFQKKYPYSSYRIMGIHVDSNAISCTPMSIALAIRCSMVLEKTFAIKILDQTILSLAVRWYSLIDNIEYDYEPRKVIICGRNGIQSSAIIKRKILSYFKEDYFQKLDLYNFYEVRKLDATEYDYVLINFPSYSYRYDLPFMVIDQTPSDAQLHAFFMNVILSGYLIEPLYKAFHFSKECFYDAFKYKDRETFIAMLAYKYGHNYDEINTLTEVLLRYDDICIRNEILFIIIDRQFTSNNYFEVYQFSKLEVWIKKEIRCAVFISVDFDNDAKKLRFIEHVTHQLSESIQNVKQLLAYRDQDYLIKIAKTALMKRY